jgi:hypothetical protein
MRTEWPRPRVLVLVPVLVPGRPSRCSLGRGAARVKAGAGFRRVDQGLYLPNWAMRWRLRTRLRRWSSWLWDWTGDWELGKEMEEVGVG